MSDVETTNVDRATVDGFGDEWTRFDYSLPSSELEAMFEIYFEHFPWSRLPEKPIGFDAGCGTARWARLVAPRVHKLVCVDASTEALAVARKNLRAFDNCELHESSVMEMPIEDGSMDFGYSLGVLHHIPDTEAGLRACVRKLKPGAPFLVYLYYSLDNRPLPFRAIWKASDVIRRGVSILPYPLRYGVSQMFAAAVYYPLARTARLLERVGVDVSHIPLSAYRERSFYVMRTDALDRFGTQLEQRFSRREVDAMMRGAGLSDIRFNEDASFWTAVGFKRA